MRDPMLQRCLHGDGLADYQIRAMARQQFGRLHMVIAAENLMGLSDDGNGHFQA